MIKQYCLTLLGLITLSGNTLGMQSWEIFALALYLLCAAFMWLHFKDTSCHSFVDDYISKLKSSFKTILGNNDRKSPVKTKKGKGKSSDEIPEVGVDEFNKLVERTQISDK